MIIIKKANIKKWDKYPSWIISLWIFKISNPVLDLYDGVEILWRHQAERDVKMIQILYTCMNFSKINFLKVILFKTFFIIVYLKEKLSLSFISLKLDINICPKLQKNIIICVYIMTSSWVFLWDFCVFLHPCDFVLFNYFFLMFLYFVLF